MMPAVEILAISVNKMICSGTKPSGAVGLSTNWHVLSLVIFFFLDGKCFCFYIVK